MAKTQKAALSTKEKAAAKEKTWVKLKRDKWMYLLLLPGTLYFIIFKIIPMWGVLIAFKDYFAGVSFLKAPWIGLTTLSISSETSASGSC